MSIEQEVLLLGVGGGMLASFCIGIVVWALFDTARAYVFFRRSVVLVQRSMPFERLISDASQKILVLGDSTAVGTGCENSELSTAGRLAMLYPQASVRNLAVNGLRLEGLRKMLDAFETKEHFALILVQIGANDIIRFTDMDRIKNDAAYVFERLSQHTDKLVVLHSGDVGKATFFPFYIRPFLSDRSARMRQIYLLLTNTYNAKYVDLMNSPSDKLLSDTPRLYYAADKLHLNGAGYGLWFSEIKKLLG